jgi:predicted small integral membrane protein
MASRGKIIFAALFGILYLIAGITMIVSAVIPALGELTGSYYIPSDPAGGFVLCVIGAVFVFAYRELSRASGDGPAFLYIGMALSVIFGIVALVSLGAQGIEIMIFGEGEPWDPLQLAVPMLYLAFGSLAGLSAWGRAFLSDLTGA